MKSVLSVLLSVAIFYRKFCSADFNPAYVCSGCILISDLIEESAQYQVVDYFYKQCSLTKTPALCTTATKLFLKQLLEKVQPEVICGRISACSKGCPLFSEWPIKNIPDAQPDWPTERRQLLEAINPDSNLVPLLEVFQNIIGDANENDSFLSFFGHMAYAIAEVKSVTIEGGCGHNLTCKALELADQHLPFVDHDGDKFAPAEAKRLRGNHWRGIDCNDDLPDIYPGRKSSVYPDSIDHNCNGISGRNASGSYEEIFCSKYPARGIIMLGDSATAHFHIPPQWVTAKGWNIDQLVPTALNELDFPMCSWGTGHVDAEQCPFQSPVPGTSGIVSLYSQLRERNRCNHNDYQNIGVNGARVTSSLQLVDSMARSVKDDNPVLVWFSLIGNDVCNGHPGFDHMTPADEFYTAAVTSLKAIDAKVPPGSHVVALSLFNGELLYDIMHARQHPVGARYEDLYDFMNCLEENPCWGWLNSNATDRRKTTLHSRELNLQYKKIEAEMKFNNFEFIFYDPDWVSLFYDYEKQGYKLEDLVEKTDGFHPSQAGNALFALTFFDWLQKEHSDALGPINPYNEEIDRLFFSST